MMKPEGCPERTWRAIYEAAQDFLGRGRFAERFDLERLELIGVDLGMAWYKVCGRREVQTLMGDGLFATITESNWKADWFYVQIPSTLAFEVAE